MFNLLAVSADAFALHVAEDFKSTFGSAHHPVAKRLESVSRLAVECIARCDALYHNLEHTLLVTVVGIEILRGMKLSRQLDPEEYAHMLIACLLHDIGYVRGSKRRWREQLCRRRRWQTDPFGARSIRCFTCPISRGKVEAFRLRASRALA
jgi:hypothetical protein